MGRIAISAYADNLINLGSPNEKNRAQCRRICNSDLYPGFIAKSKNYVVAEDPELFLLIKRNSHRPDTFYPLLYYKE